MLGNHGFVFVCSENPLTGGGHLCMFSPRTPEMPGQPLALALTALRSILKRRVKTYETQLT